jgi:hypothetical protein
MEIDSDPAPAYSQVRDALDNELAMCREKLQRDIRRSHRRWNDVENEARLRLATLGYRPKHSGDLFGFVTPNTSAVPTTAKTKVFSPISKAPEEVSPEYHHILVSDVFEIQTPVPKYHHCHSTAHNVWSEDRDEIKLAPECIPEHAVVPLQATPDAASAGKYAVLGSERSQELAELVQRLWYFESGVTRFIESLGFSPSQICDIMNNPTQSLGLASASTTSRVAAISLISRAVVERCDIDLQLALSYWLRPDVKLVARYCRICKK